MTAPTTPAAAVAGHGAPTALAPAAQIVGIDDITRQFNVMSLENQKIQAKVDVVESNISSIVQSLDNAFGQLGAVSDALDKKVDKTVATKKIRDEVRDAIKVELLAFSQNINKKHKTIDDRLEKLEMGQANIFQRMRDPSRLSLHPKPRERNGASLREPAQGGKRQSDETWPIGVDYQQDDHHLFRHGK
jgi:hypothetical protein